MTIFPCVIVTDLAAVTVAICLYIFSMLLVGVYDNLKRIFVRR